ncbi:MAG: ABC transporter ATP-binding protein [Bacillota bacterium]
MGAVMIACTAVRKTYRIVERRGLFGRPSAREVPALRGISLTVPKGQRVGLLGPNGAGKTSLLKILATLLIPDAGAVRIDGVDPVADPRAARMRIGTVLANERSLYWKLTATENLSVFGGLYNLPAGEVRRRGGELLERVGLTGFAHVPVEKYSTGMRKRLMIARALLHRPPVLILDEPTSGLDVQGKRELWALLRDLTAAEQVTVLIATHDMEEAESLPERLLLIHEGQLHADGTPHELKQQAGKESRITVETAEPPPETAGYDVTRIEGGTGCWSGAGARTWISRRSCAACPRRSGWSAGTRVWPMPSSP